MATASPLAINQRPLQPLVLRRPLDEARRHLGGEERHPRLAARALEETQELPPLLVDRGVERMYPRQRPRQPAEVGPPGVVYHRRHPHPLLAGKPPLAPNQLQLRSLRRRHQHQVLNLRSPQQRGDLLPPVPAALHVSEVLPDRQPLRDDPLAQGQRELPPVGTGIADKNSRRGRRDASKAYFYRR